MNICGVHMVTCLFLRYSPLRSSQWDKKTATKEKGLIPQLPPESRKIFFIMLWKVTWLIWGKSCYDLVYFNGTMLWKHYRLDFCVDLREWDKLCCPALSSHLNWIANASCEEVPLGWKSSIFRTNLWHVHWGHFSNVFNLLWDKERGQKEN